MNADVSARPSQANPNSGSASTPRHGARRIFFHSLEWLVLAVSLFASAGGWFIARKHDELAARKRFDDEVNRIQTALSERMSVYENVLHGGVGLFAASTSVKSSEWKAYVETVFLSRKPRIEVARRRIVGFDGSRADSLREPFYPSGSRPYAALEAGLIMMRGGGAHDYDYQNYGPRHSGSAKIACGELKGGFRFIERLCEEWASGANRFDALGEALFLAIAEGQVVGVCGLNRDPYAHDPRTGRVRRLYVLPAHRCGGVGRALLEAVIAHAHGHFDLLRVRTEAASDFYTAHGFRRDVADTEAAHVLEFTKPT